MIGLVDADLIDGGTRHPNLALLKIAGFLCDNNISFELITDTNEDISRFDHIYLSRVFTFTELPRFYKDAIGTPTIKKFSVGGTGFYVTEPDMKKFADLRCKDMGALEFDEFLCRFPNKRGGEKKMGVDMARQMPYYDLYRPFIDKQVANGVKIDKYKDYLYYSIGFLTRGCVRHCPFCVNKLENGVRVYSELDWFLDNEKNESGHYKRPYIYLWDDNFLASRYDVWKPLLQQLIDSKRPFQFRQGLDERMLAQSPHGEEMAQMLSKAKYHGDFIFAFDNWSDRIVIERALKIWKQYNPKKSTKFYLFCGFMQSSDNNELFYKDLLELFSRIKVLMQYGCVGYVMRHEDYHNAPISNIYVQIARWCNQQQFYKKMSFWEFTYRNQSYWEEKTLGINNRPHIKTFSEFMEDYNNGYYDKVKMCLPLVTFMSVLNMFPEHRDELLIMFNYKMDLLLNPSLWSTNTNNSLYIEFRKNTKSVANY